MAEPTRQRKRHWTIAVVVSLLLGGGIIVLFSFPERQATGRSSPLPPRAVTLVSETDRAVNDEAVLLDPTPLFLPTKWNASQREVVSPEIGGRFQGFDAPKFSFSETEIKLGLPSPVKVAVGPGEVVSADGSLAAFVGFGRPPTPSVELAARGAYFEIVRAANGKRVLAQSIVDMPPVKGAWRPVEFLVGVDAAGLVGPMAVTVRSGFEEVDGFFAKHLTRILRIGERLEPGFYRIFVGP
jgi:hypothetical protein